MTEIILPKGQRPRILERVTTFVAALSPDRAWVITIKPYARTRSDAQNRYLWGVAYKLLQEATGQEAEDWHEYMLGEWSGWDTVDLFGRRKLKPRQRSSKLTTGEFSDYVAFIQRKAAENGIYIPDPE